MNANDLLEIRTKEIKKEEELMKNVNVVKNPVNKFCRAFFGVTGALLLVGGMPGVGAAFLATAVGNHYSLKHNEKLVKNRLDLLKKESDHVAKVKGASLDGSAETNRKRVRKIQELENRKATASSQRKTAGFVSGLANAFHIGSLVAAVCVPAVGWVSLVSLAAKYLAGENKIEKIKEDDTLGLRLNNLNLDMDLIRTQPSRRKAAATTTSETVVTKGNSKQKASDNINEKLVDAYVESLDGIGEEENTKQLIK